MKKIKKNLNNRFSFKKNENRRLILKTIANNLKLKKKIRWVAQQKFLYNSNKNSICRVKNICVLTGRARGIFNYFRLSRIKLRTLISEGFLPGFSKISW